jgi:predicted Rossmann-fold nucleotide-binding protein
MEAVSKGAAAVGGRVIGVTAPQLFAGRSGANPYVSDERPAGTLADRIGKLIDVASGAIVLPGSIGTAAELVVAWNLNHVRRNNGGARIPTVAVGPDWREMCQLLSGRMGAFAGDVHVVATAGEAVDWMLDQPEIR